MMAAILPITVNLISPVISKLSAGSIWHVEAAVKMLVDRLPKTIFMQNIVMTDKYFALSTCPILRSTRVAMAKKSYIKTSVICTLASVNENKWKIPKCNKQE